MNNILIRLIGWRALFIQAPPTNFDRWRFLDRYLLCGDKRTLDVGCGAGEFTLYSALVGNRAIGLSFDEQLNRIGRTRASILNVHNIEFVTGDIRKLDQLVNRLGTFDQIVCFETIEHILNDNKLIADMARLLNPGGLLLLTTPYKNARFDSTAVLSAYEDGGHVRFGYTFEEIDELFSQAGLDVAGQEFLGGVISQRIAKLIGNAGRLRYFVWAVTLPFRLFQLFDPGITRLLRYPFLSVGVVGIKRQ
jgi:SAM-dependent methyltransferase